MERIFNEGSVDVDIDVMNYEEFRRSLNFVRPRVSGSWGCRWLVDAEGGSRGDESRSRSMLRIILSSQIQL